jgi:hypothetical protein
MRLKNSNHLTWHYLIALDWKSSKRDIFWLPLRQINLITASCFTSPHLDPILTAVQPSHIFLLLHQSCSQIMVFILHLEFCLDSSLCFFPMLEAWRLQGFKWCLIHTQHLIFFTTPSNIGTFRTQKFKLHWTFQFFQCLHASLEALWGYKPHYWHICAWIFHLQC